MARLVVQVDGGVAQQQQPAVRAGVFERLRVDVCAAGDDAGELDTLAQHLRDVAQPA